MVLDTIKFGVRSHRTFEEHTWGVLQVIGGQEAQEAAAEQEGALIILSDQMHHPRAVHLGRGAAQLVGRYDLSSHLLEPAAR